MTKTKHIAYTSPRPDRVAPDGEILYRDEPVYCGDWDRGSMALCEHDEIRAKINYPQGWMYYPGDVCRHGMYTGGCGADLMCGPCEMGE